MKDIEKKYPSSAGEWNIITNTIANLDYADSHEGTSCISFGMLGSGEQEYFALIPDTELGITTDNVLKSTIYFYQNTDNAQAGHIFNYVDSDNYFYDYLDISTNKIELHQVEGGTDTTLESVTTTISETTQYELETHLDLFSDTINVILDGTELISHEVV